MGFAIIIPVVCFPVGAEGGGALLEQRTVLLQQNRSVLLRHEKAEGKRSRGTNGFHPFCSIEEEKENGAFMANPFIEVQKVG